MQNAALDNIYEVRLCCLTQNYTNNQSKIRKNASSAFWDKMEKKVLAKQDNAQKSAGTIGKRLSSDLGFCSSPDDSTVAAMRIRAIHALSSPRSFKGQKLSSTIMSNFNTSKLHDS